MNQVLLVRYGEIHLKGLNRPFFERKLLDNIRAALAGLDAAVRFDQGRIFVEGVAAEHVEEACLRLTRVFGVHSISPALAVEKEYTAVAAAAESVMEASMKEGGRTFKCFCRRADKTFPMDSQQIDRELGHDMLERFPELRVDVREPQIKLCVEIRDRAFVYAREIMGAGGMPTGTAGRAMLLISGGIDSPVAGYMMARRGMSTAIIFTAIRIRANARRTKSSDGLLRATRGR